MGIKKQPQRGVVRDLYIKRLVGPGPSQHHVFEISFKQPPGVALALQRNFFEGGPDIGQHRGEDFYSLYIVRSGRGIEIVDGHPYVITRGDVYIIPPGLPHGFRDYEELEMDAFYFQTRLFVRGELAALREIAGFWQLFISSRATVGNTKPDTPKRPGRFHEHRLHLTPDQHHQVEAVIEEMRIEIDQPGSLGPQVARCLFFRLLGTLARWHSSQVKRAPVKKLPQGKALTVTQGSAFHAESIAEAIRYCEANFQKNISLPQLAARAFLSPDHFSSLFSGEVGMTPAAYLRRLRLEHAQSLLRTTGEDMETVARRSGFGGVAQLSRAFRARFDISPTAYRARFGK